MTGTEKVDGEKQTYDVCLSFAGEDRQYVEAVAENLRSSGIRCFYDRYEGVELWGKDLYEHLSDVYSKRSRYCVLFISEHYSRKLWTNHERKSAQSRAFRESREYILPARFDDTEIPGLEPTVGYVSLTAISPKDFADLVIAKVRGEHQEQPASEGEAPRSASKTSRHRQFLAMMVGLLVVVAVGWSLAHWQRERRSPASPERPLHEPTLTQPPSGEKVATPGDTTTDQQVQNALKDAPIVGGGLALEEPAAAQGLEETGSHAGTTEVVTPSTVEAFGDGLEWSRDLASNVYVLGGDTPSFTLSLQGSFGPQEVQGPGELAISLRTDRRRVLLESLRYRTETLNQRLVALFSRADGDGVRITVDLRLQAVVELAVPRSLQVLPRAGGGFQIEPFYTSSCDFRCYEFLLRGEWSAEAGSSRKSGDVLAEIKGRGVAADLTSGIELLGATPVLTNFSWHGNTGGTNIPAIIDEEIEGVRVRIVPSYGSFHPIKASRVTSRPPA